MELKYLMIDGMFPIVWAGSTQHKEIAEGTGRKVTSAGFVKLVQDRDGKFSANVYGHSQSLGMVHDPRDAEFISLFVSGGD